jgi:hypothetical protein
MRAIMVVVVDKLRRWRSLIGIRRSTHSWLAVLTQRSTIEFARGARIGVRRLLIARAGARLP